MLSRVIDASSAGVGFLVALSGSTRWWEAVEGVRGVLLLDAATVLGDLD